MSANWSARGMEEKWGMSEVPEGEEKERREWFSKKNGTVCRVWKKTNKVVISESLERERRMSTLCGVILGGEHIC